MPTTLGPFLLCIEANTLRSAKVRNAIASRRGTVMASTLDNMESIVRKFEYIERVIFDFLVI